MGFADQIARVDRTARSLLGGEPVLYLAGGGAFSPSAFSSAAFSIGASAAVTGIFDERYVLVQGSAQSGVVSVTPAVFLQLADLPSDPRVDADATVTIRGADYKIVEPRFAGMGSILLLLQKVV